MPRTHEITAYAQQLILEYNRARKLLRKYFKKRHNPDEARAKIKEIIDNMTARQSKIIGYTLNDAFRRGTEEGNNEISNATISAAASSVYMGFDLTKVADTHLKNITQDNIGHIGKFNSALTKQLQLQYNTLLADNKLVASLSKNGWTPWLDKALEKRGVSAEVIALAKGQTTTKKIIDILEMEGIRGGKHPREVSKMLLPHIQRHFGPEGVVIDNVGKFKKVLKVDADGNYKYVKQAVTRPYRATHKAYSNLLTRTSMIQAHHEGRYQSLQKTGLVDHYISVSVLDANTCDHCAMMHGQRVSKEEGPLYHPSCACDLKPIWKKDSGLKNKDPSVYENQRDKHFWKQKQLADYNKNMPRGAKLKYHSMMPKDALVDMPGKEAMQEIRYNALGKPAVIKPKTIVKKVVKPTEVEKGAITPKRSAIPETTKEKSMTVQTDTKGITEKLKPQGVNWIGDPTNKLEFTHYEEAAADWYKRSGYQDINNALRGKETMRKAVKETISDMDSALLKSKVPGNMQVFRGLSAKQAEIIKKTNGCVNKGYTSTTYNPDNAFTFAKRGEDKFYNLMELKVKKGTKALMWPGGENEVMLERGLKLKCTGIKEINNFAMKSGSKAADKVKKVRIFIMEAV